MIFILVGILIGIALATGAGTSLSAPAAHISNDLITAVNRATLAGLNHVGWLDHSGHLKQATAIIIASAAPGIVAIGLIAAAKAARGLRRSIAAVLLVGALLACFVLPWTEAMWLVGIAVILAIVLAVFEGIAVQIPCWALATMIAIRTLRDLFAGKNEQVARYAAQLAHISGFGTAQVWRVVVALAIVLPFLAVFEVLNDQHD